MTTKELIDAINEAKLDSPHYIEDEFGDEEWKEVAEIDRDEHRWYVISTRVFEVDGAYIGVCGPTGLKSEMMGWSDIGMECVAFEMEAIPSVTYRRKGKA